MIQPRRIISVWKVGHSTRGFIPPETWLDDVAHIGSGIREHGYKGLYATQGETEAKAGITRRLILNPGGNVSGRPMEFDQLLRCRYGENGVHPKLPWAYADLASATAQFLYDHPGHEVIGYIGSKTKDKTAWRIANSTAPIKNGGMSLGLDACTRLPASDPFYKLVRTWSKQGRKVYAEPAPFEWDKHWHDVPCFHCWHAHKEPNPPTWPAGFTAERIVLLNDDYEDRAALLNHARRVLATGATVGYRWLAMPGTDQKRYWGFTEHGITMEEMFK